MATNKIIFTKMHGLGNDYIYVDASRYRIPDPRAAAIRWSAPHTGIGSDGLLTSSMRHPYHFSSSAPSNNGIMRR